MQPGTFDTLMRFLTNATKNQGDLDDWTRELEKRKPTAEQRALFVTEAERVKQAFLPSGETPAVSEKPKQKSLF